MDKIFNRVAQFQQIRTGFVVGLDESRFGLDFAVFTGFYRVFFLGRSQERDWLSSIRVVADSKPSLIDRIWLIFVPFLWSQHPNEERKKKWRRCSTKTWRADSNNKIVMPQAGFYDDGQSNKNKSRSRKQPNLQATVDIFENTMDEFMKFINNF